MILGWPGVDIIGVTTNLDASGRRAGCTAHVLRLAGREAIPVVAGSGATLTALRQHPSTWGDDRYWPEPVPALPSPPGAALTLLADNIADGATVIAIGALTNLALLAVAQPGVLDGVPVVVMGGWLTRRHLDCRSGGRRWIGTSSATPMPRPPCGTLTRI